MLYLTVLKYTLLTNLLSYAVTRLLQAWAIRLWCRPWWKRGVAI